MNNQALIARITVYPHPTADRIQLGQIFGFQVVVGKDVKTGDIGIFFPEGVALSEEYAKANDLIRRKNPETGQHEGGFFEENRRVRCQKFMKEKSEGYWAPLSSLSFVKFKGELKEGTYLDTLNGIKLCEKYITRATRVVKGGKGGGGGHRGETPMFKKHFDTSQLRFHYGHLRKNDLLIITLKMHGTSQRVGHVYDGIELPRWKRFVNWVTRRDFFTTKAWKHLIGSRNMILEPSKNGFYKTSFRDAAALPFMGNLHRGETVFYEIVGYAEKDSPIMATVSTKGLKDKEIQKQYGEQVVYSYGCENGKFEIYVYRITTTNLDGVSTELSWDQVKFRCEQLGVKHVPELERLLYDGNEDALRSKVESYVNGPDYVDPSHPVEGIVLRVESGRPACYKHKGFVFGVLEGYIKESETYVDMEEAS